MYIVQKFERVCCVYGGSHEIDDDLRFYNHKKVIFLSPASYGAADMSSLLNHTHEISGPRFNIR